MTDIDAALKRAFAEAEDPADDGFAAAVTARVARREQAAEAARYAHAAAWAVAVGVAAYGLSGYAFSMGPDLLSWLGVGAARAENVVAEASGLSAALSGLREAFNVGASQLLMLMAAGAAAGTFAVRVSQD